MFSATVAGLIGMAFGMNLDSSLEGVQYIYFFSYRFVFVEHTHNIIYNMHATVHVRRHTHTHTLYTCTQDMVLETEYCRYTVQISMYV